MFARAGQFRLIGMGLEVRLFVGHSQTLQYNTRCEAAENTIFIKFLIDRRYIWGLFSLHRGNSSKDDI